MTKRILIAALLASACTRPVVRLKHWRQDLAALADEISSHHKNPFFHVKEADWRKAIEDLDAHVSIFDDAHIEAGLLHIVAMIGDAHTRLYIPQTTTYPVRFLWFDDGIVVGAADPANAWAIGKKVVGIGNRKIDDAAAILASLVPYENAAGMHDSVPPLMSNPIALVGTDLVLGDEATFVLADGAGTKDLKVKAVDGAPPALVLPKPLPLHLQGPTQLAYWNKYVPEQRLLYFQYNACENDDRVGPFVKFAKDTLEFADQHPIDRFVIDLRGNSGGSSLIIEPLLLGIAARPALAGRVFVLIGQRTFSSAMMNASQMKDQLGATLVGTPTGGNPNGYGEVKPFELPNSHFEGQYSTNLFKDDRYPGNTIPPDILVHVTSDDWFDGRDPAMDAVLAAPVPTAAAPSHT